MRTGRAHPQPDDPYAPRGYQGGYSGARPPRRLRWKRIIGITLLVIVLAAFAIIFMLWLRLAAFNDRVSSASAASSALWGPLGGSERVNIAFFGYGGAEHEGAFLSDSINVLSIDPASDTTTLVAIPRDLWVEGVAALPGNGKINEAFAAGHSQGGIDQAGETATAVLSGVTGLEIDHWLALDFEGFRHLIDAVGGVTVQNPTAFEYTWDEGRFNRQEWEGGFAAGEIHLSGEEALTYVRARYTSVQSESSDFARSVRQQRVLGALRGTLGDGGPGSLGPGLRLMDALDDWLRTDLSAIDLALLSGHINADRRVELPEGQVLMATTNSIGQYILIVVGGGGAWDYAPLHGYIREQLDAPAATAP